jgi:hypothetical protein
MAIKTNTILGHLRNMRLGAKEKPWPHKNQTRNDNQRNQKKQQIKAASQCGVID